MSGITIIMPMAGAGTRFRHTGEFRPKPLIPVHGVPMFRLAAASLLSSFPESRVICIILAEHDRVFDLSRKITSVIPNTGVVLVPRPTAGSLETCLAADMFVEKRDNPIVVLDCDLTFFSAAYCDRLRRMMEARNSTSGLLLSFHSHQPRYSYALVEDGKVKLTVEKKVISDHALIGAYGFASARLFFRVAQSIVSRNIRTGDGEFYVSSAFNELIGEGLTVELEQIESYWSFGTPDELAAGLVDPMLPQHMQRLGVLTE